VSILHSDRPGSSVSFIFWGANFHLKNMVSTYTKDFSWKRNGSNSPDFKNNKTQIAGFL
jgi:hypothetical protein